jgi:hypothetical protein
MTPAEKIAIGLLGWKLIGKSKTHHIYSGPNGEPESLHTETGVAIFEQNWPDLTDWNTIRRIEDELFERGWFEDYIENLRALCPPGHNSRYIQRATAEQCVDAAIRTIEAHGGGK